MCDVTHLMCDSSLLHTCDVSHFNLCDKTHSHFDMRDMTHSHVGRDALICRT